MTLVRRGKSRGSLGFCTGLTMKARWKRGGEGRVKRVKGAPSSSPSPRPAAQARTRTRALPQCGSPARQHGHWLCRIGTLQPLLQERVARWAVLQEFDSQRADFSRDRPEVWIVGHLEAPSILVLCLKALPWANTTEARTATVGSPGS